MKQILNLMVDSIPSETRKILNEVVHRLVVAGLQDQAMLFAFDGKLGFVVYDSSFTIYSGQRLIIDLPKIRYIFDYSVSNGVLIQGNNGVMFTDIEYILNSVLDKIDWYKTHGEISYTECLNDAIKLPRYSAMKDIVGKDILKDMIFGVVDYKSIYEKYSSYHKTVVVDNDIEILRDVVLAYLKITDDNHYLDLKEGIMLDNKSSFVIKDGRLTIESTSEMSFSEAVAQLKFVKYLIDSGMDYVLERFRMPRVVSHILNDTAIVIHSKQYKIVPTVDYTFIYTANNAVTQRKKITLPIVDKSYVL